MIKKTEKTKNCSKLSFLYFFYRNEQNRPFLPSTKFSNMRCCELERVPTAGA